MNASSILTAQGWSGPSAPLNPLAATANTHITKPLLFSQKRNTLGVGYNKPQHARHGQDQWWLRDFDETLKGIGVVGKKRGKDENDKKDGDSGDGRSGGVARRGGVRRGAKKGVVVPGNGLYGWFVKGEVLRGSFEEKEKEEDSSRHREEGESTTRTTRGEMSGHDDHEHKGERRKTSNHDSDKPAAAAAAAAAAKSQKRKKRRKEKVAEEAAAASDMERAVDPSAPETVEKASQQPNIDLEEATGERADHDHRRKTDRRKRRIEELEQQIRELEAPGTCETEDVVSKVSKLEKKIRKKRRKLAG